MANELLENAHLRVGRLNYFLGRVIMIAVMVFAVVQFGPESRVFGIVSLATMIAGVVLDVMRLRNIGVSQWLIFLRFVPYLGLLLSIGLQTAQTNWFETKRLDRPGWLILATHAALILLVMYMLSRTNIEIFGIAFR